MKVVRATRNADCPYAKIRRMKTNRSRIHQKLEKLGAVKDAIHGYLACMSYADAMIGRVLDTLAAGPHANNTIVILWSDHGYHHGEKGDWGKHTLWERTSNVPFIWAGPGIARGRTVDATVSLIDMYPTIVEMCALAQPDHHLEGRSLAATLKDPAQAKDRDVYLPFMTPGAYAMINRDWRYIHYADNTEELYDVQADPNEWTNLASDHELDAVKARMRGSAPHTFAEPGPRLNRRRHLVLEGERFHWDADRKPPVKPRRKGQPREKTVNAPLDLVYRGSCQGEAEFRRDAHESSGPGDSASRSPRRLEYKRNHEIQDHQSVSGLHGSRVVGQHGGRTRRWGQ